MGKRQDMNLDPTGTGLDWNDVVGWVERGTRETQQYPLSVGRASCPAHSQRDDICIK